MSAADMRSTLPVRLVLQRLIEDGRVYGMRLSKELTMETATIYGILERLRRNDVVEVEDENLTLEEKRALGRPGRKYYKLTESGRQWAVTLLDDRPLPMGRQR